MKHITMLIIDDSRLVGLRLQRYFRSVSWISAIHYADTFERAEELLAQNSFDLIVLDHHFPEGYGSDFLATHEQRLEGVPVVLYSAFGSTLNHARYRQLDIAAIIDKSASPEELLATVEAIAVRLAMSRDMEGRESE